METGGRVRVRPAGVEVMGQVDRSSLSRDWAPSRAVDLRDSLKSNEALESVETM